MAARISAGTQTSGPQLVVERVFDAPRRLVFRLWTQPEHAARWWGPHGFTTLLCQMDVRPGGAWRRRMRSPEGTVHVKRGVYREVAEPERLVFGPPGGGEDAATLTLTDLGDGRTAMTFRTTMHASDDLRARAEAGLRSAFDRLAELLD